MLKNLRRHSKSIIIKVQNHSNVSLKEIFKKLLNNFNLLNFKVIFNLGGDQTSKENGCFTQLKYFGFYQALLAELIGTYLLVLYVCSFGLPKASSPEYASITGSLGSGFLVATLVWVSLFMI